MSVRAAIIKYHTFGGLNNRNFFSSQFWRLESLGSRFWQGLVPDESSLLGLQTAAILQCLFLFL